MSDPRYAASRMSSKPINYGEVGGGTPGLGITGLDVSAAMSMGGADEGATLMVMAKWVQDESAQPRLFYITYTKVIELAIKHKWKPVSGEELFRKLTRLAILEVVDPKCCPACGGRREVWVENTPRGCVACSGTGRKSWSDADRARATGISPCSWSKTWAARYSKIIGIVASMERRGLAALSAGLGGD